MIQKNAADEKEVEKATKNGKLRRDTELADIRYIMDSQQGRRFMWRLVNGLCHYDTNDAQHSGSFTFFSLGERNIGRIVKSDLYEASPELFQKMERENWKILKGDTKDE
jgi:hypothetical protein